MCNGFRLATPRLYLGQTASPHYTVVRWGIGRADNPVTAVDPDIGTNYVLHWTCLYLFPPIVPRSGDFPFEQI